MKIGDQKFTWFALLATASIFFCFTAKSAHAGDPIPGVDVSLEQIPGGIVGSATTDKHGKFLFDKLKPGKYVLHINKLSTRAVSHNSSRSNYSRRIDPLGIEELELAIELLHQQRSGSAKYEDVPLVIRARQGRISGQITLLSAWEKEDGTKIAPPGDTTVRGTSCADCAKNCPDGRCVRSGSTCFCYSILKPMKIK